MMLQIVGVFEVMFTEGGVAQLITIVDFRLYKVKSGAFGLVTRQVHTPASVRRKGLKTRLLLPFMESTKMLFLYHL